MLCYNFPLCHNNTLYKSRNAEIGNRSFDPLTLRADYILKAKKFTEPVQFGDGTLESHELQEAVFKHFNVSTGLAGCSSSVLCYVEGCVCTINRCLNDPKDIERAGIIRAFTLAMHRKDCSRARICHPTLQNAHLRSALRSIIFNTGNHTVARSIWTLSEAVPSFCEFEVAAVCIGLIDINMLARAYVEAAVDKYTKSGAIIHLLVPTMYQPSC